MKKISLYAGSDLLRFGCAYSFREKIGKRYKFKILIYRYLNKFYFLQQSTYNKGALLGLITLQHMSYA